MEYPRFSTVAELLKPITWFPPVWAFACGAVSSGRALPVQLGVVGAAKAACLVMLVPQLWVSGLLLHWGALWHALAVVLLMLAQLPLMHRFIQSPVEKALSVSAFGVPLFVAGMMVSAWALRLGYGLPQGLAA